MELKRRSISKAGIVEAVSKAELYRCLGEPEEVESICRDIPAIEPEHQLASRLLGLALTDQFAGRASDRCGEAGRIFQGLRDPYERSYCTGLLHERRAKAQPRAGHPPHTLLPLFEEAMRCFAAAEKIRPTENDDAILRWNRCVRLLQSRNDFGWEQEVASFDAHDTPPA